MKKSIVLTCSALALVWSYQASAIPFNSSGIWTSLNDAGVSGVTGVGTSEVEWGTPFGDSSAGPSGYTFDGVPTGDAPLNGNLFAIGDFTHSNFTIELPSITGANLEVDLSFTGETPILEQTFSFFFEHTETRNNVNPCAAGGINPCPDLVSLPDASSSETVVLEGTEYLLEIVGFQENPAVGITSAFLTTEGAENTATLFARLVEADVPVEELPVPSTVALTAMGLIGLWAGSIWRRRPRISAKGASRA